MGPSALEVVAPPGQDGHTLETGDGPMHTSGTMRRAVAAGAVLTAVLTASLTACGGGGSGSSAPSDASKDEFCTTFNSLFETLMSEATASADASGMVAAMKKWAAKMEDVGTPSDMPDDARHGFELFVSEVKKLDDNATAADLDHIGDGLSSADQKDGEAFGDWTTKNCPLDLPSIDPSDLPSIDPSDLPSMDPSDLESMMSDLSELTQSP